AKAAREAHRGIGSLLERGATASDPVSTPGRFLRQAHEKWQGIRPPPEPEPEEPSLLAEWLTPLSRTAIQQAAEAQLEEVDAYLERLALRLTEALGRRVERLVAAAGAAEAQASASAWREAEERLE